MKKQIALVLSIVLITIGLIWLFKNRTQDELLKVMPVPEFELINQEGEIITNEDMLGQVYVVEFFFRNCPTICPIMNANLQKVMYEINDDNFSVIGISIDPKRDSVEALKDYKNQLKIENPNWYFTTKDRDYIFNLSEKFNIFVEEDYSNSGGLEHSGKVALVDKNGIIRSRFNEIGMPILYYSALNYETPDGKTADLKGKFSPEIDWLIEDIKILLKD